MISHHNYILSGNNPTQSINQTLVQSFSPLESSEHRMLNNESQKYSQLQHLQVNQQNQQCLQSNQNIQQQQLQFQLQQSSNIINIQQDINQKLNINNDLQFNNWNVQQIQNEGIKDDKGHYQNQEYAVFQNSQITIPMINQIKYQYNQGNANVYNNQLVNSHIFNNFVLIPTYINYNQMNSIENQTQKMIMNQFQFKISNLQINSGELITQQNTLKSEQTSLNTNEQNNRTTFSDYSIKQTPQNNDSCQGTFDEKIGIKEKQTDLIYLAVQKKIKKKKCNNCVKCLNKKLKSQKIHQLKQSQQRTLSNTPSYWFPLDLNTNEIILSKIPDQISSKKIDNNQNSLFLNESSQIKTSRFEQTRSEKWQFMKKYYNKSIINNKYIAELNNQNSNPKQSKSICCLNSNIIDCEQ